MSVNIDDLMLDIDILIYGLRSVEYKTTNTDSVVNKFLMSKQCMIALEDKLIVLQNHFKREFIAKQEQKILIESVFEECIQPLKQISTDISNALQSLHYPLPNWLIYDESSNNQPEERTALLNFELRLFNWLSDIREQPMDINDYKILTQEELYQQLDTRIPEGYGLLGWLKYETIFGDWKYADLRLNNTLSKLTKEWQNISPNFIVKNEVISRKSGLLVVYEKINGDN